MELSTPNPKMPAGLAIGGPVPARIPNMAKKQGFTVEWKISIGAILQIVGLLFSGIWYFARFEANAAETRATLNDVRTRLERVEKYISSKDPHYWQAVGDLREGQ